MNCNHMKLNMKLNSDKAKEKQPNRPFSYSENEGGSNDISLQFVGFSNEHNCDRSSNATLSNLVYKIV